jgi:hypothetical protein
MATGGDMPISVYLLTIFLLLGTVLLIFGMKYFSAVFQARAHRERCDVSSPRREGRSDTVGESGGAVRHPGRAFESRGEPRRGREDSATGRVVQRTRDSIEEIPP